MNGRIRQNRTPVIEVVKHRYSMGFVFLFTFLPLYHPDRVHTKKKRFFILFWMCLNHGLLLCASFFGRTYWKWRTKIPILHDIFETFRPKPKIVPSPTEHIYIYILPIFRWTFFNLQTNLSEIERRVAFNYWHFYGHPKTLKLGHLSDDKEWDRKKLAAKSNRLNRNTFQANLWFNLFTITKCCERKKSSPGISKRSAIVEQSEIKKWSFAVVFFFQRHLQRVNP